ncbi:MAG: 50S ribosomal protein L4 [Nitrosomonadales bacterium]|jgi:large subunit ribosomal protein L4
MEFKLVDNKGKTSTKTLKVSDEIFAQEFKEGLVHQLVVSYQSNARVATRAQKTRAEVRHSTKKPYRQKGTGNARAGMTSSPLWRSGGRTFPNKPNENFSKKLNKKAYRVGMKSIFSELARQDRLVFVEDFSVDQPKTKSFIEKVKNFEVKNNLLILTDSFNENLYLASRNVPSALVVEAQYVDPVSLVHFEKVVVTAGALKKIEEMFA